MLSIFAVQCIEATIIDDLGRLWEDLDTGKFKDAKKAVCKVYPTSHVHDATSCAAIIAILAEADGAPYLSQATASTRIALAVDEGISFLDALTDGMDRGEAFAIASNCESLVEQKSRRSTTRSTRTRQRSMSPS